LRLVGWPAYLLTLQTLPNCVLTPRTLVDGDNT
jgi:hypothetical protein